MEGVGPLLYAVGSFALVLRKNIVDAKLRNLLFVMRNHQINLSSSGTSYFLAQKVQAKFLLLSIGDCGKL